MTERNEPTLTVTCVVCGRPMTLARTVGHPCADEVSVFECLPCGFSEGSPKIELTEYDHHSVWHARYQGLGLCLSGRRHEGDQHVTDCLLHWPLRLNGPLAPSDPWRSSRPNGPWRTHVPDGPRGACRAAVGVVAKRRPSPH